LRGSGNRVRARLSVVPAASRPVQAERQQHQTAYQKEIHNGLR
jgi:hypothetical protein